MEVALIAFAIIVFLMVYSRSSPKKNKHTRRYGKRRGRSGSGRYIYIYKLKDGRRAFYVGQTNNPDRRLQQHIEDANRYGTRKQQYIYWMGRSGRTPGMEILTKTKSPNKAHSLEVKYIQMWGTHNTLHR